MAERKVDVMAKSKGSLAERLKKRRMLLEAGDPEAAANAFRAKLKMKKGK